MRSSNHWIDVAKESYKEALDPEMAGLEPQLLQFATAAALISIAETLAPLIDDLWDEEFDDDVEEDDVWVNRVRS